MLLEEAVHAIINNKRRKKMEGTAEKDDAHYRGNGVRCHQELEVLLLLRFPTGRIRPFVVYLSELGSNQSLSQSTHWRIQL